MAGTETKIRSALEISAAITQSTRNGEKLAELHSKALDFLRNPALLAALAGGSLSLGGSELCASARSHQAEPPAVSVDERAGDTGE